MQHSSAPIAVIGLGYVGLPLAVEFGRNRNVIGFDINKSRINELKRGVDRTLEISDEELKDSIYLSFSNNLEDLKECKIFIITVPTPINKNKEPDLIPLKQASNAIGSILKKGDIVIYEST
ncbi:MAG: Vi polysaccharide biosynthesis UDP-N-acetylglucosamine C-6 dehydrogenase TviB, partial [Candidatus Neomarinimicrobiota bacterium]